MKTIIIILLITAVSVATAYARQPVIPVTELNLDSQIQVWKFNDGNITCYLADGYYSGGISCLK